MSITINIGDAEARLSELVARAEWGEEIIISRDNAPVALLSRLPRDNDVRAAIEEIRASRAGLAPTSAEEILQWRLERDTCRAPGGLGDQAARELRRRARR